MNLKETTREGRFSSIFEFQFIFLLLSFFFVFSNVGFFYLYPLALEKFGAGPRQIGFAMGIFSLSAVVSRPLLGKASAAKGEYPVLCLGLLLLFLSTLFYNLISSYGTSLLLLRILHGLGFSCFIAASFSIAARRIPGFMRAQGFSFIGVSIMASIALAPPAGEFIVYHAGFHTLYFTAALMGALGWFCASRLDRGISSDKMEKRVKKAYFLGLITSPSYLMLLLSTLLFSHCQASVINFLALLSEQKGTTSGKFFFVTFLTALVILICSGKVIDRFGRTLFLRSLYPFFACGIILIPFMIGSRLFPVSAILMGAGIGFLFPVHNALAAAQGTGREKSLAMSTFTAVYDTGFFTGAYLSGWIVHTAGLETLFTSCGLLAFAGFILVLVFPVGDKE